MLMSTNGNRKEKELKLNGKKSEGYSPEMETSIWYN
jgi:hypothetical protein